MKSWNVTFARAFKPELTVDNAPLNTPATEYHPLLASQIMEKFDRVLIPARMKYSMLMNSIESSVD